jgi:hypothetical protein
MGSQDFVSSIDVSGYEWRTLPTALQMTNGYAERRVLVPREWDGERRELPLRKHPELYRTFVALEPTEEAVQDFADRYGLLGTPTVVNCPSDTPGVHIRRHGELLHRWRYEIHEMRRTVEFWKLLNKGDEDALRAHAERDQGRLLFQNLPGTLAGSFEHAFESAEEQEEARLTPDDLRTPALVCLKRWINRPLKNYVGSKLMLNSRKKKLEYTYAPRNLLGALWLQVSELVTGVVEMHYCRECGKPIPIKKGGIEERKGRKDHDLCGNTCAQRAKRAGRRVRNPSSTL